MISPVCTAIIASRAVTESGVSDAITTPPGSAGALFMINISAATGTQETINFTLQALNPATGTYVDLASTGALSGTSTTLKTVYPGSASPWYEVMPATYRIKWAIGGTPPISVTFSVGVHYLP